MNLKVLTFILFLASCQSDIDFSFNINNSNTTSSPSPAPAVPPFTCPTDFIYITADGFYTNEDYCVAKYELKDVGGGTPGVSAQDPVLITGDFNDALAACSSLGPNYDMISNNEWQQIAREIDQIPSNWIGGVVNVNGLYVGNHDNSVLPVTDSTNPYSDILTPLIDTDFRRTLQLSSGEEIWDLSGNAIEWVKGNLTAPLVSSNPFLSESILNISESIYPIPIDIDGSLFTVENHFGPSSNITADNLLVGNSPGYIIDAQSITGGSRIIRGSSLEFSDQITGISDFTSLYSALTGLPDNFSAFTVNDLTTRCAYRQNPTGNTIRACNEVTTCPTGYVKVNGNNNFEPCDFCISQFEMRNDSGTLVSNATSPVYTVDQVTDMIRVCEEQGSDYELMTNDQWQTIAHEIEAIPQNWYGGVIGQTGLYTGPSLADYSDLSTSHNITNLNDKYFSLSSNTSTSYGSGGEMRRTFVLDSGEEIWDLSGSYSTVIIDDTDYTLFSSDLNVLLMDPSSGLDAQFITKYGPLNTYPSIPFTGTNTIGELSLGYILVGTGDITSLTIRGGGATLFQPSLYSTIGTTFDSLFSIPTASSANQLSFRCVWKNYD